MSKPLLNVAYALAFALAAGMWAVQPATAQGLQAQSACLAHHLDAKVPGHLTERGCHFAWEGEELWIGSYSELHHTGPWGRLQDGTPLWIGSERRGRTGLCRATYGGHLLAGKLLSGECLIGFQGRVINATNFEVLLATAGARGGSPDAPPTGTPPTVIPGNAQISGADVCAREGQTCGVRGSRIVAYGAGDRWFSRLVSGAIECGNGRFGDPAPGQAKQCVVSRQEQPGGQPEGLPLGSAWRDCAREDGECRFEGVRTVRYGANGRYLYRVATGFQRCDFRTFGQDPIVGVHKTCSVQEPVALAQAIAGAAVVGAPAPGGPAPAATFAACGTERQGQCSWSPAGTRLVRYGEGDAWFLRLATGQALDCTFRTHGDPVVGRHKACEAGANPALVTQGTELVGRWRHCADEAGTCQVPQGPRIVRYGTADRWVARLIQGNATCGVVTFGTDPYFGRRKICEVEEPLSRAETDRALTGQLQGLQRQAVLGGGGGQIQLGAPR